MENASKKLNRRTLLKASAVAAPTIISASVFAQTKPIDRVRVGVIGLGSRGFNLLDEFLTMPDVQLTAICDVDRFHYRDRPWGKGRPCGRDAAAKTIASYYAKRTKSQIPRVALQIATDFRDVCRSEDVDAVVVATPDHWHAFCALEALRAGKDVYCEKPVTHTFAEGQAVYREVAKQSAVFQTGSQQRSESVFRRAVELVRNGHLGELKRIEVGLPPGYATPQGDDQIKSPPEHLDYDQWCGPSQVLPYMRARHHRWWRGHREYGGGVLMDWIGHHNDIAHWAMDLDSSGPSVVEAVGWTEPKTKVYNSPHQYTVRCEYASGVQSTISSQHPIGTRFIGERGWIFVTRGKITASDTRWLKKDFNVGEKRVDESPGHIRNFLDCIRTRKPCIAPAETAHRSITPGHLAYVSHALQKPLRWDPEKERILDDESANALLQRQKYRGNWKLT